MIKTRILTTADADQWRSVLPMDLCVQGSLEYVRICEIQTGWPARLFVIEDERPRAAYPYFLRPISELPFEKGLSEEWFDICTPEYRGPVSLNGGLPPDGPRFADLFSAHCREQRIVAEFAHLNPWTVPKEWLEPECVQPNREIVYTDLTRDEEWIWNHSFSSDGRRQTKQAQRAGVSVRRASSIADIREFHRIYTETMERRRAHARYFFPAEYFLAFFETMPRNAFYALAEFEGKIVAGGLYFQDQTEVYWHLSAADRSFARVRPVNLYLYETIRSCLGTGRSRMIMGGGYEQGDGVLHFKTNFSPLRAQFATYQRVHHPICYKALTTAWIQWAGGSSLPQAGYFPAYRSERTQAGDCLGRAGIVPTDAPHG